MSIAVESKRIRDFSTRRFTSNTEVDAPEHVATVGSHDEVTFRVGTDEFAFTLNTEPTKLHESGFSGRVVKDVYGRYKDNVTVMDFHCPAGTEFPWHKHAWKETIFVAYGKIRVTFGSGRSFTLRSGERCVVFPNETHSAFIIDDSLVIATAIPPLK